MVIVSCAYQIGLTFENLFAFHRAPGLWFGKYCSRSCEYQRTRELTSTAFCFGMTPLCVVVFVKILGRNNAPVIESEIV